MKPRIEIARSCTEHRSARRFWYDTYVTEMGRHADDRQYVDHTLKELSDPMQHLGNLFVAKSEGTVLGSVLSTYGGHGDLGYYSELYGLQNESSSRLARSSITNKLIVHASQRRSSLALRLAIATYRQGFVDGITRNYIDCNEHLVDFFFRMGFVRHRGWVEHKDYGRVYSMVLKLQDIEHLQLLKSPLARHYHELSPCLSNKKREDQLCQ